MTKHQIEVLHLLLDKYERSKTYKGENKIQQRFYILPWDILFEYVLDYADVNLIRKFNREMNELEEQGLVVVEHLKHSEDISKIYAIPEKFQEYYQLLGRQDITAARQEEIELYQKYKGIHKILDDFCNEQIERLSNYRNAECKVEIAENVLNLLKFILTNTTDLMERELSMLILHDSKLFKDKYEMKICGILETYGEYQVNFEGLDKKEIRKIILEEFHIFSNPSYIYFHGNIEIRYRNGNIIRGWKGSPIAILSTSVKEIETVVVSTEKIITIENLTAFNRYECEDALLLYLSGYHNTAKQTFLQKIAYDNKGLKWYHFGDIDPDGYYILKNLTEKTRIPFEPLHMGISELEKYSEYCKPLEKNDQVKAESLMKRGYHSDVMQYILENGCKLEQEIVSLNFTHIISEIK